MLSKTENEELTQVGPETLMGDLVRQYWIPFFLSSDLEVGGPPARVRLLSEDLIAFRASSGHVGLVGNNCPHRGASLFFGRNEENGLRCVYHGWKFDATGACVDMPNEPPESNFKHKIHHSAYPCRERNGIVWTYMGPLAEPPELPQVEWNLVPSDRCYYSIRIADENFMQAVEGEYDNTHNAFIHGGTPNQRAALALEPAEGFRAGFYYRNQNRYARFSVVDTDYGVLIGAARPAGGDHLYYRTYPFSTPIAAQSRDGQLSGHAWVPMDDMRTICLCFSYNPTPPLSEPELHELRYGNNGLQGLHPTVDVFHPPSAKPYPKYWPRLDTANDYGLDYEAQKMSRFSGLPGTWPQDSGMQQSMGFVVDRTKEHLGAADTGQIAIRRRLLNAARALRERGVAPPGVADPQVYWVRPAEAVIPRDCTDWVEATREHHTAGGPILHWI